MEPGAKKDEEDEDESDEASGGEDGVTTAGPTSDKA